ncbi:T9SS type A sorting domain-containing protein [Mesonia aestuariivivens]|uniref:T9SS type A sorting domain-containing protein n=1 Tax=Mesonia aestuariivivens TaxID=2796128 RepID=A0ABS6W1I7_9FLAO|nr:T9SS type A sorting domain-containing protein [Mesonia aestuariivivens]MBW2961018.1 T9SS type A sorting domain-containing protein [Mesonia aestuariivivens]
MRPDVQRNQIKDFFSINTIVNFNLNVSDVEAGFVKVNTIEIQEETPGVYTNPYPWSGQYFEGVPVNLEAIALPGYEFSHWSGDMTGSNPELNITPSVDMQIQANFVSVPMPSDEVVYFWLMDGDIPNDTSLLGLDATYASNNLSATINYSSCLTGYPFTDTHPDWRTASFERKSSPTAINYVSEANDDIPYSEDIMKGVQVKQPFKFGSLENYLEFLMPTRDLENIKFSFAVETNGAAETILIDYWDGNAWSTDGLVNATVSIPEDYEIREFDFSNVSLATNNPDFKVRMRFDGEDMFMDNGDKVKLNNIALMGDSTLSSKEFSTQNLINIYPNPTSGFVNIESENLISKIELFDIFGNLIQQYSETNKKTTINMESFAAGMYFLKVHSENHQQTLKLMKR